MADNEKLLSIKDLTVYYITDDGTVKAVNDLSLDLNRGETLGLVGETGAGKTTTAYSIMGLIPNPPGKIISGSIEFEGKNIVGLDNKKMRAIRGKKISMIFQDPMTALNPIDTVGEQIAEVIKPHENVSKNEARKKAEQMLEMVGIPKERYDEYPHQFSGGMKQRIVIAIALACSPELLIADEPTTALDVTIQSQVLDLMNGLKKELGTSMILITHDLGIVAETCDKVAVIYAGEVVEFGNLVQIFDETSHPYTKGLFNSLPDISGDSHKRLSPIPGMVPDPTALPEGCVFFDRCPYGSDECKKSHPKLNDTGGGHMVRCIRPLQERG